MALGNVLPELVDDIQIWKDQLNRSPIRVMDQVIEGRLSHSSQFVTSLFIIHFQENEIVKSIKNFNQIFYKCCVFRSPELKIFFPVSCGTIQNDSSLSALQLLSWLCEVRWHDGQRKEALIANFYSTPQSSGKCLFVKKNFPGFLLLVASDITSRTLSRPKRRQNRIQSESLSCFLTEYKTWLTRRVSNWQVDCSAH